jgi:hypothetical protein|tara:strand:+ start:2099 stop:2392 length:294 start_codon:yes stop_codon:yes gene_type:complete|eukprot:COSAG01_NODE_2689_length_7248_cov_20.233179_5_plen_98_part_00
MGRISKLKKENMKKVNELLDKGHNEQYPQKERVLKPSDNVTNTSPEFVNKMNRLKEGVEPDSYYIITKAQREDLIKLGGVAKEVGNGAESYDKFKPN